MVARTKKGRPRWRAAAADTIRQRAAKARPRVVHLMARPGLPVDAKAAGADTENTPATPGKREPADEQIGSARRRLGEIAQIVGDDIPCLPIDEGDLPAPTWSALPTIPRPAAATRSLKGNRPAADIEIVGAAPDFLV